VRTIGLVCALLATVAVSGCSGGSKAPVAPSPTSVGTSASPSATTVASPTTDASPTPTTTSSPSPAPPSGAPECTSSALQLRAVPLGAATGTDYIALVVTNTGDADCVLVGYPGVTFLDSRGQQVGLPAQRDETSKPRRVVIAAGEKAHAQLSYPNPDFFGNGCGGRHAKAVQFYPPDQTTALRADVDAYVCTDKDGRAMVGAMRPGTRGA
jgi:hypothetical protein